MNAHDFSIQTEGLKGTDYIILQSGKGKEDNSSLYMNLIGFSYIEGLLWDKYREYRKQKKTKIPAQEWVRILEGFQVALDSLRSVNQTESIKEVLRFEIINPDYSLSDLNGHLDSFSTMIEGLISWVSEAVKTEKYILILKKHL